MRRPGMSGPLAFCLPLRHMRRSAADGRHGPLAIGSVIVRTSEGWLDRPMTVCA